MEFSRHFFLKGLGGVTAASGASTSLYFLIDQLLGPFNAIDIALMDYLDDGGDIKFYLKAGYGDSLKTSDLYFLNTNELSVAAEVFYDDKHVLIEKSSGNSWDKGKNATLKKLNWGRYWRWRCEMNFVRKSTYLGENKIGGQYWLFGGFFRTLSSESGDNAINKKMKKDFIRKCAIARNSRRMEGEVIRTPKEKINLHLVTKDSSMLYFGDEDVKRWWKWLGDAYSEYNNSTSIFDRVLIDYLDDGGDIQFKITKGDNKSNELNSSPDPETTIKVSIGTADNSKTGTLTDGKKLKRGKGGQKEKLKRPNGEKDWTWNCEIKFDKGNSNSTNLKNEFGDKYLFFNNSSTGFLNKLKEKGNEEIKMNFIKSCAETRGKEKNNELDEKSRKRMDGNGEEISQINSEKTFNLRAGKEHLEKYPKEDANKYYFESEVELNKWFPKSLNF